MVDSTDLSTCCRLCFSSPPVPLPVNVIFSAEGTPNQTLIAMIYECTSIRISFERDYPCAVCNQCLSMLQQFHGYRKRCLANERQLRRDLFGDDNSVDEDPLEDDENGLVVKKEHSGMDKHEFYEQVQGQIREFLDEKAKEIERKALAKVNEAMRRRPGDIGSEVDRAEDGGSSVDWRSKYEILQQNNELLQKAFRDLKSKLKETEQQLRSYRKDQPNNSEMSNSVVEEQDHAQAGGQFAIHPALPGISTDFLRNLNYNSGPGEKGDRHFISHLAVAVFGETVMVNSSVTGRPSNSHHNIPPKPPLCPQKIAAIGAKLYERVKQEVGRTNRAKLLQRSSERVVRLVVCQKSMNLRKQVLKRGGQSSSGGGEDELLEAPKPSAKRRAK